MSETALSLFPLPRALAARGISLRLQSGEDAAVQEALFVEARRAEFDVLAWDEESKRDFLAHQSALQQRHYGLHYKGAELYTVLERGVPIGRFYIDRLSPSEIRLVDFIFFATHRGTGLGTAFLEALLDEAGRSGKFVGLHVEEHNPARRLYQRLGFRDAALRPPYIYMRRDP